MCALKLCVSLAISAPVSAAKGTSQVKSRFFARKGLLKSRHSSEKTRLGTPVRDNSEGGSVSPGTAPS